MITNVKGVYHAVAHHKYQSLYYEGLLEDRQLNGNTSKEKKRYVSYEQDPFTQYQNFLYKRALYGLNLYTKDEVKQMHWEKRNRIKNVHKKAQQVLNLWRQEYTIAFTNTMFTKIFSRSKMAQEIIANFSTPDPEFNLLISFKDLGITKSRIVEKLIQARILPSNFYELKEDPNIKLKTA